MLLNRIAVGGMAEIHLARKADTQEHVVIKKILPYLSREPEFVQMFLDEARIAAQLHHPNIIQLHELSSKDDLIYIAMEYVDGVDLRNVLLREIKRGGHVPYGVASWICARLCEGLYYAHNVIGLDGTPLAVIHRDVSPQNVMLSWDGKVKLVDFGIAKAGALVERSKPGVIKGKFLYLAPEQLTQDRIDHRADLFALGTLMYEVTTGKSPFYKNTTEAVIYAVRAEDPPPPHLVVPDYPLELSRIVMKCLAKDRARRYQQAQEIRDDLEAFLALKESTDQGAVARYLDALFADEGDRTILVPQDVRRAAASSPGEKATSAPKAVERSAEPKEPPKEPAKEPPKQRDVEPTRPMPLIAAKVTLDKLPAHEGIVAVPSMGEDLRTKTARPDDLARAFGPQGAAKVPRRPSQPETPQAVKRTSEPEAAQLSPRRPSQGEVLTALPKQVTPPSESATADLKPSRPGLPAAEPHEVTRTETSIPPDAPLTTEPGVIPDKDALKDDTRPMLRGPISGEDTTGTTGQLEVDETGHTGTAPFSPPEPEGNTATRPISPAERADLMSGGPRESESSSRPITAPLVAPPAGLPPLSLRKDDVGVSPLPPEPTTRPMRPNSGSRMMNAAPAAPVSAPPPESSAPKELPPEPTTRRQRPEDLEELEDYPPRPSQESKSYAAVMDDVLKNRLIIAGAVFAALLVVAAFAFIRLRHNAAQPTPTPIAERPVVDEHPNEPVDAGAPVVKAEPPKVEPVKVEPEKAEKEPEPAVEAEAAEVRPAKAVASAKSSSTRVAVIFHAPSGTKLGAGKAHFTAMRTYRLDPGSLKVWYRCPGRHGASGNLSVDVQRRKKGTQAVRIPCSRK